MEHIAAEYHAYHDNLEVYLCGDARSIADVIETLAELAAANEVYETVSDDAPEDDEEETCDECGEVCLAYDSYGNYLGVWK